MDWYKIATDLGSLIGGVFALLAGVLAYVAGWLQARATRLAADRQIAAAARERPLSGPRNCRGIWPELLIMKVDRRTLESPLQRRSSEGQSRHNGFAER